jgi:dCTP deaminase
MMLSGVGITEEIEKHRLMIDPFNPAAVNPNSYNMRLDKTLLVYKPASLWDRLKGWFRNDPPCLDMARPNTPDEIISIPQTGYTLWPGWFYLGNTMEYTRTDPPWVPAIEGRSSIGRLGLSVHATAGFGDCGFMGTWTLELSVIRPLRIYAGVPICQISYVEASQPIVPYSSDKYQGQRSPRVSQLWKDLFKGTANAVEQTVPPL